METKVTLKLDKTLIDKAEAYASAHHLSLSEIVEMYLKRLVAEAGSSRAGEIEISPFVKSMATGVKLPTDIHPKDAYRDHLSEKLHS
ncbi:conserved hypothetical protein [Chloroherpeton thalassium ATCC 35110]|uniref:Uncharacterized protein n=1 Tax=Chloroherpeton thalassium (strain ATCC 35110 / GB-78) TaxID=517418 RepID=B3QTK2_CHLT3|nr:DUF6364 family protein [Chloroherpeton thalassium]ACF12748.1 conserved hypothetical protein [Chloroherpeton thalassium ATCC 35110]